MKRFAVRWHNAGLSNVYIGRMLGKDEKTIRNWLKENNMGNKIYVTFQVRFVHEGIKKYAVECKSLKEAREIAADVNSFDGVTYLRLNKCGVLPQGTIVTKAKDYDKFQF